MLARSVPHVDVVLNSNSGAPALDFLAPALAPACARGVLDAFRLMPP